MSRRDYLKEAKELTGQLTRLVEELVGTVEEHDKELEDARRRIEELESEDKRREDALKELEAENAKLKEELGAIREQLERMSATYRELVAKQEAQIPVQDLLALYITLVEDVFGARPHAKVLFLLHGAKTTMTREEITKTAGHEAAIIRKALADLARANLVDYDLEAGQVRLLRRLYPTKASSLPRGGGGGAAGGGRR